MYSTGVPGTAYVLSAVICGILLLLSLVMTIISIANNKNRNALVWGLGLLIFLCGLVFSIMGVAHRIGEKVRAEFDEATTVVNKHNDVDNEEKKMERQTFLDTLQNYTNEKDEGNVPVEFYINRTADTAEDGSLIVPFLYPYKIRFNSESYLGSIILNENDSALLVNISQFAFDKNFVIARVENSGSPELLAAGRGEIEYVFFDRRSGEFESFPNKELMLKIAGKVGYTGSSEMSMLSTAYNGWVASYDYDYNYEY
jgi:hypothetical protein